MNIALRYAARSDIGLGRYSNNQDSGYAGPHLLVIADGMGGHAAGDVASSTAIARLVALDEESAGGGDALERLTTALADANQDLRDRVAAEPSLHGMGTTVTALLNNDGKLALAHIGDSRGYLLRDGQLTQITHDHTFVQSLVDDGRLTEEEARSHPQRNLITRVLTGERDDTPDLSVREAKPGDTYLLCSDGLTGVVTEETLTEVLGDGSDVGTRAERLIDLALKGGSSDNITCVVADVVDLDADRSGTVSTTPEVVGAAAAHQVLATGADATTPAGKAAALTRSATADDAGWGDGDDVDDDEPKPKRHKGMLFLLLILVIGLVGGGGYAAYAWSQQQYFVGTDAGQIAIYRGLPAGRRAGAPVQRLRAAGPDGRAAAVVLARPGAAADHRAQPGARRGPWSENLRDQAATCATATPTTTPSATPSGSASATARRVENRCRHGQTDDDHLADLDADDDRPAADQLADDHPRHRLR